MIKTISLFDLRIVYTQIPYFWDFDWINLNNFQRIQLKLKAFLNVKS